MNQLDPNTPVSRRAHQVKNTLAIAAKASVTAVALACLHMPAMSATTTDAEDAALVFSPANFTTLNITVDGVSMAVRWYKEVCYVAKPVLMASTQTSMMGGSSTIANPQCGYQSMNIYVPESVASKQDTPIYLGFNNTGWMASYVATSVKAGASLSSSTSNVGAALAAGYVYVDVGTRGRGITAADGSYAGKAPAAVVDAKAAIRYLRLNDSVMPGSAERIVINGTSGGGGLVSMVGASGNSSDYLSDLATIGAAGIDANGRSTLRDNVLAVIAYCPISDLSHADWAYEWLYTTLGTRATVGSNPVPAVSTALAAKYPAYLRSLHLRNRSGQALTADNMMDAIKTEVIRSAEAYLAASASNSIPALGESFTISSGGSAFGGAAASQSYTNDWISVDTTTRKVVSLDMTRYLAFVATQNTLKSAPAFDQTGLSWETSTGESNLFGTSAQAYSNFTEFSWTNNDLAGDGIGYSDTGLNWVQYLRQAGNPVARQTALTNPLNYLGGRADTAPYWYVRAGTRDRDTAFTVSYNLSRAVAADPRVVSINYQLAWGQPHAGNYDVPEAMQWLSTSLASAAKLKR